MKRIATILITMMFAVASITAHTYTSQSVLSSGKWVKIRVSETGIHCLTYDELRNAGLNPDNVRVYGYGGAMLSQNFRLAKIDDLPSVAFYMHMGDDGVFNSGDYILFYAQGVDSWEYTNNHFVHTRNPYSRYGYYFLTDNAGEQRLIEDAEQLYNGTYHVYTYTAYMVHDKDSVNLVDISGKAGGGREFYGEQLNSVRKTLRVPMAFHDIVPGSDLDIRCRVASASSEISTFTMAVGDNSYSCTTDKILVSDFYTKATTNEGRDHFTLPANGTGEQTFSLSFANSLNGSRGYLNYVEMSTTCNMVMAGQEMPMTFVDHLSDDANTIACYHLKNATEDIDIWDITDLQSIKRIPPANKGDIITFYNYCSPRKTLLALNPNTSQGWRKPTVVGEVKNQNLHALSNIDLVIICPEEFTAAARLLLMPMRNTMPSPRLLLPTSRCITSSRPVHRTLQRTAGS